MYLRPSQATHTFILGSSEFQRVGILASGQAKPRLQVRQQDFSLGVGLNCFQDLLVNRDLIGFTLGRRFVTLGNTNA